MPRLYLNTKQGSVFTLHNEWGGTTYVVAFTADGSSAKLTPGGLRPNGVDSDGADSDLRAEALAMGDTAYRLEFINGLYLTMILYGIIL